MNIFVNAQIDVHFSERDAHTTDLLVCGSLKFSPMILIVKIFEHLKYYEHL